MTSGSRFTTTGILVAIFVAACTSDDSTNGGGTTPVQLDSSEVTGTADAATDDLLVDGALLDDSPEADATTTSSGNGQGLGDGGGPLDGGGGGNGRSWRIAKPLYKILRAWGALVPSSCITDNGWVDADGDGIPASTTFTFACTAQPGSGRTIDVSGAVAVSDTDDASAGSGYKLDFTSLRVKVTTPNGGSRERTVDGSVTVTVKGTPPALANGIDIARDLTIEQVKVTPGTTLSWTHTTTGTISYVPDTDVANDPFARGTVTGSGSGTNTMTVASQERTRNWTRRTDPSLHWNRACDDANPEIPGFDSGAVVHEDGRGNLLRIEFTACGMFTVTLNGAAVTP